MNIKIIILLLVTLQSGSAVACSELFPLSALKTPLVGEKYDASELVVLARAHSKKYNKKKNVVTTKFRVKKSWKNESEKWIFIETDYYYQMCSGFYFDFQPGQTYLLYLNPADGVRCYSPAYGHSSIVLKSEDVDIEVALLDKISASNLFLVGED